MTNHPNRSRDLPPLARAIKAYRAKAGLSQRAFAEARDIPASVIRDMEQAATSPDTHLASLAAWAIEIIADAA